MLDLKSLATNRPTCPAFSTLLTRNWSRLSGEPPEALRDHFTAGSLLSVTPVQRNASQDLRPERRDAEHLVVDGAGSPCTLS